MARFSIVIPTLNEEKFLPKLLSSLAAQTRKDFEVIVVDGSSKDKTVSLAKKFVGKLPKLQVIISTKASLPLQRNMGAQAASGEWLIFVDADSILAPYFIQSITRYIHDQKPAFFTTWMRPDSEDPRDANIALLANILLGISLTMHRPLACGPLTAVTRQAFDRAGGYNEAHTYNEDVDFSLRVSKLKVPIRIIPETLYTWSLRRLRHQGTLKVIQQYTVSALPILFFNKPLKKLPGYFMGGHLYNQKKKIKLSSFRKYERKLTNLLKELFE